MLKYIDTVKIPTYAVCYIFNGDCSGMDDADIEAVDKFCEEYPGATYDIPDMDNPYFTNSPAFGLACDVYDMDIYMDVAVPTTTPEEDESKAKNEAYGLMVAIGEIQNDYARGETDITFDEVNELYDAAVVVNEYFENKAEPKEKKYYILDADYIPNDKTHNDLTDEEFMALVKEHGWTLTAEQLAAEISEDGNYCPVPQTHFVRYI